MPLRDAEAPEMVNVPAGLGKRLWKLFRDLPTRTFVFADDGENELHVNFEERPRIFSSAITSFLLDARSLTLRVLTIHVGPCSGRRSLEAELRAAGATVSFESNELRAIFVPATMPTKAFKLR